jgi:hypothetical protein
VRSHACEATLRQFLDLDRLREGITGQLVEVSGGELSECGRGLTKERHRSRGAGRGRNTLSFVAPDRAVIGGVVLNQLIGVIGEFGGVVGARVC